MHGLTISKKYLFFTFRPGDEENNIALNHSQNSTKVEEVCKLDINKYLQRNQISLIFTCTVITTLIQ